MRTDKRIKTAILILLVLASVLVAGCDGEGSSDVGLVMEKTSFSEGESVEVSVNTVKDISTGHTAFSVYKLVGDEERLIDVTGSRCLMSCSIDEIEICNSTIPCAPVPAGCFNPPDGFKWDQKVYKSRKIECPGGDKECFFTEKADAGAYKLVFRYSDNCVKEDEFEAPENNVKIAEKRFDIR